MPLIILGILVVICILIYAVVLFMRSDSSDNRPVRERYLDSFSHDRDEAADEGAEDGNKDSHADTDDSGGDDDDPDPGPDGRGGRRKRPYSVRYSDDGKTLIFPTENVEKEKHKRNIH